MGQTILKVVKELDGKASIYFGNEKVAEKLTVPDALEYVRDVINHAKMEEVFSHA